MKTFNSKISSQIRSLSKRLKKEKEFELKAGEQLKFFELMDFYVNIEVHYQCGCTDNENTMYGLEFSHFDVARFYHNLRDLVIKKVVVTDVDLNLLYEVDVIRHYARLHVYVDGECTECRETRDWKKQHRPDSLFQGSIYCHGLATGFSGQHLSVQEITSRVLAIPEIKKKRGEICCSWKTQPIGGCGFYLSGDVTVAANRDVWSHVNKLGERVIGNDSYYWNFLIERREDLNLSLADHTEFFVVPRNIRGFWIKDWFVKSEPRILEVAKTLEEGMGVKTYIIHRRQH